MTEPGERSDATAQRVPERGPGRNRPVGAVLLASTMGALATLGILIVVAVASRQIGRLGRALTDLPDTLEMWLDQQIDAGFGDPVVRADDPLLATRRILLGHDINAHTAKDVATRLLYLDSLDANAPIDLFISTQGGWEDSAFTIIDAMRIIEAPVNTWAIGGCHSAGALILAAGTGHRIATPNAIIMIHTNREDSTDDASYERLSLARYENLWRTTTDLPESWYPMTSDKEYYLSPEEALRYKVVDAIADVPAARHAGDP